MTDIPSSQSESPGPSQLTPRQLSLYRALVDLQTRDGPDAGQLARMYLGAVQVRTSENADAMALAGHALRELMEKLPRHLNVLGYERISLTTKVRQLADLWKCFKHSNTDQERIEQRARFDAAAVQLVEWFNDWHTPRKQWGSRVIDRLDPGQAPLPKVIKEPHEKLWGECHGCFEGAGHHHLIAPEVFETNVLHFEDFLIDRLRPQTAADQHRLDEIIREGETDA